MSLSRALVFAAVLALVAPTAVLAAETKPSVGEEPATPPKSKTAQLDDLFATLKSAKNKEAAEAAESSIWRLWLESGSDTVDLRMSWAIKAMDQKDYSLALDFLDRIVTMKPDYAEGWNKRATVHFLTNDYSASLEDIQRALALEPRHFAALSGLGMIMKEIGDEKRAIDAFKQALAIDPNLDTVQKELDELQAKAAGKEI